MKKIVIPVIIVVIVAIGIMICMQNTSRETNNSDEKALENEENKDRESEAGLMRISVSDGNNTIIYELNDSTAASNLYRQLPLTTEVENFSSNEKIFYPSSDLNTDDTELATKGGRGVLAYYAPWADVVMFYDTFSSANGLYELGRAIEGSNQIENLSGKITIEKIKKKKKI